MSARGSIRARHHGWEIRVSAGRDADGRRRRLSRYVVGSRADAEDALLRLRLEVRDRPCPEGDRATIAELIEQWFELARPNLSPSTVASYQVVLARHILPRFGEVPIRQLSTAQLDRYYRELADRGGRDGRPLSPKSVLHVHSIIRVALNQAQRWGWITRNPASFATLPRNSKREIRPPSLDEVHRLIDAARAEGNDDFGDFLWLAAVTGARRGEVCGLQWNDVNPDAATLTIRRSIAVDGARGLHVKDTKTHAARRVTLDAASLELIRVRRLRCAEQALASGAPLGPWVFSGDAAHDEPWHPEYATGAFRRLARRLGISSRLHDLRHHAATALLDAGVPIVNVSRRLGHRDTSTTLNIYGHAIEATDRVAADVLGDALRRPHSPRRRHPNAG